MRIGVALGGGGAKGLAHIPLLEVFDDLGIRPARIAGTSIGAIVGALYASGIPARSIRDGLDSTLFERGDGEAPPKFALLKGLQLLTQLVDLDAGEGGFVKGDVFVGTLEKHLGVRTFEELEIPLELVATDFWKREAVTMNSGDLMTAVRASISLPGFFTPVLHEGRVLVDGGAVNPVPYDLLIDHCDVVLAIDVSGSRVPTADSMMPSLTESVFNTFQIMSKSIFLEKCRRHAPDKVIQPEVVDVRVLEFDKAQRVYEATRPACDELREWLVSL